MCQAFSLEQNSAIMKRIFNLRWLVLALAGVLAWNASAQLVVFVPTSGDWNVPGNWSDGSVPSASQDPIVNFGNTVTVDTNEGTCGNVYVGQNPNANPPTGTVLFRNGAELTVGNLLLGRDGTNYGQFSQMGGVLTVSGYVSVGDAAGGGTGASGEYDLSSGLLQLPAAGGYVQVGNQGVGRMLVAGSAVLDAPALTVGNTAGSSGSQLFQWGGTVNVTNFTIGSTAGESNCSYTISAGAAQWSGLLLVQDLLTVQGTEFSLQGTAGSGVGLQLTGAGTLQFQLDALGIAPIQLNGSRLSIAAGSKLIVDGSKYSRWNGSPGSFTLIHQGGYAGQTSFTATNVTFIGFGNLTPTLVYAPNTVTLVLSLPSGGQSQSGQGLLCEYWDLPVNETSWNNGQYIAAPLTALPSFTNSLVIPAPVFGTTVNNVNLNPSLRNTNYFLRFTGYVNIPTNGSYTFYLNSDDGSLLWLDGALVVNNDGEHAATEVSGTTNLTTGLHQLVVGYFQDLVAEVLQLSWAGPGLAKQLIPDQAFFLTAQPASLARQPVYQAVTHDEGMLYNYAPSFMYDETEGLYKIWFCGNEPGVTYLGDNVLYKEATSLAGLMSAPVQIALAPSGDPTKFDDVDACDPNVYRATNNLYYLAYGGNTDGTQLFPTTRIGMAVSYDRGRTFQRLNGGNSIIAPATNIANVYGTGQPAVVPANDGYYYMLYTDANGGPQVIRVVRSLDPAFSPGSFTNVANLQIGGASLDLGYDTNKSQFIVVNQLQMIYYDANWNWVSTVTRTNPFAWTFGEGHGLLMDSRKDPINYNQDGIPGYVFSAATVVDTNNTTLWANWVAGDLKYLVLPQVLTPGTNLIVNGNFSANAMEFTNWPGYASTSGSGNPSAITGWINLSNSLVGVDGIGTSAGDAFGPTNTGGGTYAFIQGGVNGLAQDLALTACTTYQLDYEVAARAGNTPNYQVQIGDGTQVYYTSTKAANNAVFVHFTATFTTPSALKGTPSIQLLNLTPGDNTIDFANFSLMVVGSKGPTEISLTPIPNPSTYGGAVILTATVRTLNGIPTGTVTFLDGGDVLGSAVLANGSGITATAALTVTNLAAATHSLTASYGGDANFAGSLSAVRSLTVNPSPSATALVSSLNPSLPGWNVTFTATVSAVTPGAGTPMNAVQFLTNGVAAALTNLNASAQASFATSWLPHGANVVTAEFVSDGNFLASTNSVTQVVNTPPVANPLTLGAVGGLPATLIIIGGPNGPKDADGDPLVIAAVSAPAHGIASTDGTNATYTATNYFAGTDYFNYTVSDNYGATVTNTVTVNVIAKSAGLNQLTAAMSGGNLVLEFPGIPWNRYAWEQTFKLSPAVWLPVATNLAPANGSLQFTNSPTGTNCFWRIRQVP
jgi:hypothetical protein